MTHPNDEQVGGSHYRPAGEDNYQVWDLIADAEMDYFTGSAFAYVARAHLKGNEKEDLRKAVHYIRKLIFLIVEKRFAHEKTNGGAAESDFDRFIDASVDIPDTRVGMLLDLAFWHDPDTLRGLVEDMETHIATLP